MQSTALKKNTTSSLTQKRMSLKEKFGQPDYILDQAAVYLKDGDFDSITDLISAYISNSSKYKNQDDFAEKIGTTRQTLHRMFAHDNVSLTVFFDALKQIHLDAQ